MPGTKELTPAQERILVESEKVLGKKGISGLELKNVAKVLKVAPSTINYYYASSEELIFDTTLFSYNKYVQRIVDEVCPYLRHFLGKSKQGNILRDINFNL